MKHLPFHVRYGLVLLAVAGATLLRFALHGPFGETVAFITFYPTMALVAMFLGARAGVVATVLSAIAADYFVMPPLYSLGPAYPGQAVALGLFVTSGLLISLMARQLDLARRREAEAAERERTREELIRAAEATERQRQLLAVTLASIGDGVIVTDVQGRVTFLNGEAERLTGWPSGEAAGQPLSTVFQVINERTRQPVESPVDQVLQQGKVVGLANHSILVAKDGRRTPIDDSGAPIRQSDGTVQGVVLVFRDFSARKAAEEALRRARDELETRVEERTAELRHTMDLVQGERRRFKDVLDRMPAYLVLLSPDYRVPFANRFFEERFGASGGRRCYEYLFGRAEPCENCETYTVFKTHAPHRWEWTGPDGRNYDIHDFPFTDADGSPMIMEVGLDITERKRAEATVGRRAEQLQALAARLTQAEQKERQRLATILHDHLQQLLVGAKFHLGMLRGRRAASDLRESLDQIDGLLDQSLETSRNLTVDLSPPILTHGNMTQVLRWLADWMRSKHGLEVKLHADEGADPQAHEVRVVLFQATRELLFNVVKHAKVDQATVELCQLDDRRIQVKVRDQGVGFFPSQDPERHNGSGFGLLAIRERLDWLNGSFEVDSRPGQGTCATLTAPIALPQAAELAADQVAVAALDQAGRHVAGRIRVLLADDHVVMRDGLADLLARLPDMQVVGKAADGQEAVDLAVQVRPDVVIMDVSMPGLDGVEATRRILAGRPGVKVIGLSMFNEEGMRENMKAAGAACYMAKTSGPDALIAAIREHVSGKSA